MSSISRRLDNHGGYRPVTVSYARTTVYLILLANQD
jgi:hypothetical protein